jgi:hypothetical protein
MLKLIFHVVVYKTPVDVPEDGVMSMRLLKTELKAQLPNPKARFTDIMTS